MMHWCFRFSTLIRWSRRYLQWKMKSSFSSLVSFLKACCKHPIQATNYSNSDHPSNSWIHTKTDFEWRRYLPYFNLCHCCICHWCSTLTTSKSENKNYLRIDFSLQILDYLPSILNNLSCDYWLRQKYLLPLKKLVEYLKQHVHD